MPLAINVTITSSARMGIHSGTTSDGTRSGTIVKATHSGTTATSTHSGTIVAILLYTTAFNMCLLQVEALILPMFKMPRYSTERVEVTHQISYKYRSKRMRTTANMRG